MGFGQRLVEGDSRALITIVVVVVVLAVGAGSTAWMATRPRPVAPAAAPAPAVVVQSVIEPLATPPAVSNAPVPTDSAVLPKYRVLDANVSDTRLKTLVRARLILEEPASADQIRALLVAEYERIRTAGIYKERHEPNQVLVRVYATEDRADGSAYLGLLFKQVDQRDYTIEVDTEQLASLSKPAETKFGLSEEQRLAFWYDIIRAERRATRESEEKFPLPEGGPSWSAEFHRSQSDRQMDYQDKHWAIYESEVTKRHGLTDEEAAEIKAEAHAEKWGSPPN